jgi:hypothetical protein
MIELVSGLIGSKAVTLGGGLGLLMAGRWLMRAQLIAEYARMLGIFAMILGGGLALGVIDVHVDVLTELVKLLPTLR